VERATELLVHSMQETDAPIADISDSLARMAAALNDPTADLRAVFARSIAVCVENIQSYDRLMQQLGQARDLLMGSRPRMMSAPVRREGTVELF
jgi:phage host-nuclease inhibitor protein Gam